MLAAAHWRPALQLFQAEDDLHAWQLRETQMGPYLALEGVPKLPRRIDLAADAGAAVAALLDFHVCFNHSYQVPTLLFRAMSIDGEALGLSALRELFPSWPRADGQQHHHQQQLLEFVMQQAHPLLPGPCWFSLHPCNTATVLALALGLCEDAAQPLAGGDAAGTLTEAAGSASAAEGWDAGAGAAAADRERQKSVGTTAAGPALPPSGPNLPGGASRPAAAAGGTAATVAAAQASGDMAGSRFGGAGIAAHRADDSPPVLHAGSTSVDGRKLQAVPDNGSAADDEDVPDLDQLLAAAAAAGSNTSASAAGLGRGDGEWVQAMVGPAGVGWTGGEVPLCPGDATSLRRYMGVWFSLVAPHVGLAAPKAR